MEFFIKQLFEGKEIGDNKKYFLRFGKGDYKRRFLMNVQKGAKIKIKTSYELSNVLVEFMKENKNVKFSGKVLSSSKIHGKEGRKKAGSFIYEVSESSLEEFENPYFYLLDANASDMVLKIKKSLPKLGKDTNKIDDKFCSLELDEKYWNKLKEMFFWDLPDNFKKTSIEHEIVIDDVDIPTDVPPEKAREMAKRKGKIIRKTVIDGKEQLKEIKIEI